MTSVGILKELWSSPNVGQGPGAVKWLAVDRLGKGQQNVVQLWNNGGQLGMIVYGPAPGGGYTTTWSSGDTGQGAGAVEFLTADTKGNGQRDIIQLWNNHNQLGMIVYSPTADGGYATSWSSGDLGQGAGAVGWLTGDLTGDGKTDIIQLWNNGGQLGMIVYSPTADGGYQTTWSNGNMGQGAGAIRFFTADANGDGKTEIIQLWDNHGKLGMIVYAQTSLGGYGVAWSTPDIGQGSGAIGWLTGDVNGDGKTEVIQLWNAGGRLGIIVYAHTANGNYGTMWAGTTMSASAVTFLAGDLTGDGKTDLLQLWDNGGNLGIVGYSFDPTLGFEVSWNRSNVGEGPGAVQYLAADLNGDKKTEIVQFWNNDNALGMIVYGLA